MITSKELAKLAGVSQSTVSRCLNDSPLVSDETKQHVKKLAAEYSFEFNSSARGLKTRKTGAIGYVFSENFSGFNSHFTQSHLYYETRNLLIQHKLDLIPVYDYTFEGETSNIEKCIRDKRFDGFIFNRNRISEELEDLLQKNRIPHIFVFDPSSDCPYDYVIASNHKRSGYLVGNAFCEKGYNKFIEVLGTKERVDVKNKHIGFSDALSEHGYNITEEKMLYCDYTFESGFSVAKDNISLFREANACFVHNDVMALGVIEALRQNGINVPDDIAIIGHDNIPMATWVKPHLTTVAIDYKKIAELATEWMLELTQTQKLYESRKITINGNLVIRDTFK